ncbi:MAG TPA: hypothetical protein VK815_03375 [Candidatus Acidoferrales bacterium]|jgi:hypothetical protein|nr:hypothetical protein [Candidatus Acidoferrales bacterium]
MRRPKKILLCSLLLVLAAGIIWHWEAASGPIYHGRRVSEWVDEALRLNPGTNAPAQILQIGAPAVPYIARQGLYGRSHTFPVLSTARLRDFSGRHHRTAVRLHLYQLDVCTTRHERACQLLLSLGPSARAAIPDLINCLERCPDLNDNLTFQLQDALAILNGTNRTALPYFIRCARKTDDLHAATLAYYIDGQTNLFVETCQQLAVKNPQALATSRDLARFADNHLLNIHVIPLLEKIYLTTKFKPDLHRAALAALESRGTDAAPTLARIHAIEASAPPAPTP